MSALFDRLTRLFDEGHREPVDGLMSDAQFVTQAPRPAAVLIAVTERQDPGTLLIRRPDDMRNHPGQVAFPGGKIDPGETVIEAALREAHEELAIHPDNVRVIGASDPYVTGTGYEVTPVLGMIEPDLPLVPNPAEVVTHFEAPLRLLLDRSQWQENEVMWRGDMRRYLEMDYAGERIWGVTAAILANLSRRLAITELLDG